MSNPIVPAVRPRKILGLLLGLAIAFSLTTGVDMKSAYADHHSVMIEKTVKTVTKTVERTERTVRKAVQKPTEKSTRKAIRKVVVF